MQNWTDPLWDTGNYDAYTQIDFTFPPNRCYYPQVEVLEEMHRYHPDMVFILNTRNVSRWVKSVKNWSTMKNRMAKCNITGFPRGVGNDDAELTKWYLDHYQRVRDFAKQHPSMNFVEVDIESPDAGKYMESIFNISADCWGHANENPRVKNDIGSNNVSRKALMWRGDNDSEDEYDGLLGDDDFIDEEDGGESVE